MRTTKKTYTIPRPLIGHPPMSDTLEFLTQFSFNQHQTWYIASGTSLKHYPGVFSYELHCEVKIRKIAVCHACRTTPCRSLIKSNYSCSAWWHHWFRNDNLSGLRPSGTQMAAWRLCDCPTWGVCNEWSRDSTCRSHLFTCIRQEQDSDVHL